MTSQLTPQLKKLIFYPNHLEFHMLDSLSLFIFSSWTRFVFALVDLLSLNKKLWIAFISIELLHYTRFLEAQQIVMSNYVAPIFH